MDMLLMAFHSCLFQINLNNHTIYAVDFTINIHWYIVINFALAFSRASTGPWIFRSRVETSKSCITWVLPFGSSLEGVWQAETLKKHQKQRPGAMNQGSFCMLFKKKKTENASFFHFSWLFFMFFALFFMMVARKERVTSHVVDLAKKWVAYGVMWNAWWNSFCFKSMDYLLENSWNMVCSFSTSRLSLSSVFLLASTNSKQTCTLRIPSHLTCRFSWFGTSKMPLASLASLARAASQGGQFFHWVKNGKSWKQMNTAQILVISCYYSAKVEFYMLPVF